ncbi:MAG: hypothetical protein V1875_01650 [Candidatus Altiarchaeota archaeon]
MMPPKQTGAITLLFSIYLAIIATDLYDPLQNAEAAIMSANVTIADILPTVGSVTCCFKDSDAPTYSQANCIAEGSITEYLPSGGKSYDMLCNFTVSDYNGYQDMADGWVNLTWHRANVSWNGPISNDTLYINNSCRNMTSTATPTEVNYECSICNIRYWADAGNWTALINLSDGQSSGIPHSGHIQIGGMKSIWQSTTIPFGEMHIGENGSNGHLGRLYINSITNNTGNTIINLQASGGNEYMNCTVGAIPVANINYDLQQNQFMDLACGNLTSSPDWSCSAFQLPDCSGICPNLASLKNTYWGIRIPSAGVGGICSRVITIIAT